MIPKKIHMVWVGPPMPSWVLANIQRWRELNPGWDVQVHGDNVLLPEWEDCYRRSEDFCTRSDLLRLSVLRRVGGWYFDTDFIPLKPMRAIYDTYAMDRSCFLTKQWEQGPKRIANGVIGITVDSPVWVEIENAIAESRLAPVERCTYGPLLATRLVQRCQDIEIGRTNDFYLWRFSPSDQQGVNIAMRRYEVLLAGNFDDASIEATCGADRPPMVHLWAGGKYDWEPNRPRLSAIQKPGQLPPPRDGMCTSCHGAGSSVGCKACGGSGFACDQKQERINMPPEDELAKWADAYGWKVACFVEQKIMLVPK